MKIYFLRHEDRFTTTSFFTPLTSNGKKNAIKLISTLKDLNISQIYSSPFIRVLQTVEPYIKKYNKKINLENSIRETNTLKVLTKNESDFALPKEYYSKFNINESYESFLKKNDIIYPESISYLRKRLNDFLKNLITKYKKTDKNILIVSHAGVIENFIRKLEKKPDFSSLKKIKPFTYPLGKVTCIFDTNKLVFQPINWNIQ